MTCGLSFPFRLPGHQFPSFPPIGGETVGNRLVCRFSRFSKQVAGNRETESSEHNIRSPTKPVSRLRPVSHLSVPGSRPGNREIPQEQKT
jgi:hypothetical protein